MKLSERIREGAKLRPQAFGSYFDVPKGSGVFCVGSCALGAAAETLIKLDVDTTILDDLSWDASHVLDRECSDVLYRDMDWEEHPEAPHTSDVYSIKSIIIDLNDNYHWSREQIADWLAEQGL
jgi:hypothetical protein